MSRRKDSPPARTVARRIGGRRRGGAALAVACSVATLFLGLATSVASNVASADDAKQDGEKGKDDDKHDDKHDKDKKNDLIDVQLLAFNDYHGHLEANTPGLIGGTGSPPAGGAEFLAAKLTELRQGKDKSVTVAAGDLIGGTPFFSGLFHDEPAVESLNAMGLDVSSVGNHEFDEGVEELLRMQRGGCHPVDGCYFPDAPYAGADFKWLSANVIDERGRTPLPPYWIKSFHGVKIAFIGMTLEDTPTLVAQAGIQGYKFLDEVQTANALVPELQDKGIEAIVVLLHEGGVPIAGPIDGCNGISGPIVAINAALDPAIDVMITGHTHQPYNCELADADGQPRRVTSAFSFGRVVSEINLVLDKNTDDVIRERTTATNHAVYQTVNGVPGGVPAPKDPAQTAILAKWAPLAAAIGNRQIGTITGDIRRAFIGSAEDRGSESSAGNLVADAQLAATTIHGAQIALMNPGGVRSDLRFATSPANEGDGVVTYGEAFTFQPFSNSLITIPMTGQQLVNVLRQQCQPFRAAGQARPVLHLGVSAGLTYDMALTLAAPPAPSNCLQVAISNVRLNGVPLDLAATYRVTANQFLLDGGDNFTAFLAVPSSARVGGGIDLDALVAYFAANSPIAPPPANRVTVTRTLG